MTFLSTPLRLLAKSDVGQTIVVFALRVGTGVISFVLFAVTARVLGPAEFGVFSILFSVAMLLGMSGSFGQQIFLVKEIPRARVEGDRGRELGAYRFATISSLTGGLIAGAIIVALSQSWTGERTLGASIAGATLCLFFALSQMTLGALRIEGRTLLGLATRDFLWRVLSAIGIIVSGMLLTSAVGATSALWIIALSLVPIVGLHARVLRTGWRERWAGVVPTIPSRDWFVLSAGLALVAVISSADLYVYTIALGAILPPSETGAFFAALKSVELINLFLMAVTLVIAPELSALVARGDTAGLQRKCNMAIILQGVPTVVSAIVLGLFASAILGVFDPAFIVQASSLHVLILGMLINALTGATTLMLQLAGMQWRQVLYQGGSLGLSVLVLPMLVARLGVVGASWAFVLSKVLWSALAIKAIRRSLHVDPSIVGLLMPAGGGVRAALGELRRQVTDTVHGERK